LSELDSRLYFSISVRPMKTKNDFTGRPSEAHDVLDPPAKRCGAIGGQRLSELNEALALFVLKLSWTLATKVIGKFWKIIKGL
jgi:hypothetical protein